MRGTIALALVVVAGVAIRAQARGPYPRAVRAAAAIAATSAVERGHLVYGRYGCGMCHGEDGKGGFANPNAETAGTVPGITFVAEGYTRPELRRKIRDGAPTIGRTDAKGPRPPYRMPGWGDRMSAREVDDLVEYLLSLYPQSAEEKWR